ncbi:class II fructose-bisphosphate aldolase [Buchnera aphidicola]|uniref:Fructose-bisphosphate aldolase n=1 Tax=Buchnera aphidicola (Stegophylla sp.) TaxID=2315800 RepID=A0A4D6YAI3_9GAMM|nr:class II fructose-bisphosphate aldolase [Buchnera aphidicola (Stegophylla sp.)]QCI26439.1 class II fructose-bisphosphate aldolase [Buchnera aphidicola (Stegophylla sp.)]
MEKKLNFIKPGIIFGKDIQKIFQLAKSNNFAIPAINCINIDSINSVLETASNMKAPVIIQFSYGGSSFFSGIGLQSSSPKKEILGSLSGAQHVHLLAKHYGVPVILHTDHCYKNTLSWIDGLLEKGEKNFIQKGYPIFSSHMIDLSQEKLKSNIEICTKYLQKMSKINMFLEIELGCTGGEEDGVNNCNIDSSLLYTTPQEVQYAYEKLIQISPNFTIAASFGNVHGVYQPGNISLKPKILKKSQKYTKKQNNLTNSHPINFVFHGGSGSSISDIQESIQYGVVKMNIDTDIQWASWSGIYKYYKKNKLYLQSQLGNPKGIHQPNKQYYDPRSWIRSSQISICCQLKKIFKQLNCYNLI